MSNLATYEGLKIQHEAALAVSRWALEVSEGRRKVSDNHGKWLKGTLIVAYSDLEDYIPFLQSARFSLDRPIEDFVRLLGQLLQPRGIATNTEMVVNREVRPAFIFLQKDKVSRAARRHLGYEVPDEPKPADSHPAMKENPVMTRPRFISEPIRRIRDALPGELDWMALPSKEPEWLTKPAKILKEGHEKMMEKITGKNDRTGKNKAAFNAKAWADKKRKKHEAEEKLKKLKRELGPNQASISTFFKPAPKASEEPQSEPEEASQPNDDEAPNEASQEPQEEAEASQEPQEEEEAEETPEPPPSKRAKV